MNPVNLLSNLRKMLRPIIFLIGFLLYLNYAHCADVTIPTAGAGDLFNGHWSFVERKGLMNAADIELTVDGSSVKGTWSYGNRERGWSGSLRGHVIDSKLYVNRCYDDGSGYGDERPVCPSYGGIDSYFARTGDHLIWYRKNGESYTEFFVLTYAKPVDINELNKHYSK